MIARRYAFLSLAAFLVTAGVSYDGASSRGSVSLVPSAGAQGLTCFTRCNGNDAACRSSCEENVGDCLQSGYGEELCRRSRGACITQCTEVRVTCERACL